MAKPMVNLFSSLENEFESLQKSLTDIDASIKKVTGKDPSRFFESNLKPARNRLRTINNESQRKFAPFKRRLNDTEEKEDFFPTKRSLQSQVVATSWETKHRNQVLEEQKNDTKSMSRNKRMFGLLLGTLEKFKSEESQRKDSKREEIEKKLDRADEQEREALKKERIELFQKRREKRVQLRCLEQKLQRVEIHKEWEKSQQSIGSFIETKTKPNIFYMPVKHNSETQKRLQETKDKYRIIFAEKRAKVQKELNDIEEQHKKEFKLEATEEEIKVEEVEDNPQEYNDSTKSDPKAPSAEPKQLTSSGEIKSEPEERIEPDEAIARDTNTPNGVVKEKHPNLNGKENENGEIKGEEEETDKDFEPMYD